MKKAIVTLFVAAMFSAALPGGVPVSASYEPVRDPVSAVAYETGNITDEATGFVYRFQEGKLYVSGYSDRNAVSLKIPEKINGGAVQGIYSSAFAGYKKLQSLEMPDTVRIIESFAFSNCSSLVDIKLSQGLVRIQQNAFENCSSLKVLNYPDSLEELYACVLEGCSALEEVHIPDSLWMLNDDYGNMFYSCPNIRKVTFHNGISMRGIVGQNFNDRSVSGLIYIPSTVTEITLESDTFSYQNDSKIYSFWIGGKTGSCAEEFAKKYSLSFHAYDDLMEFIPSESKPSGGEDSNDTPAPPEENTLNLGDVDYSGTIDSSDASMVLQEYALTATGQTGAFSREQKTIADVNGDGSVDSSDASTILSYYAYTATGGTEKFETFLKR